MKHTILCVDDELDNVEALERIFRKKYRVLLATSGAEGLNILKGESVSLIISDQRMPKMTGVQFLSQSMKVAPDAIRILLTGYTDVESVIDAINAGQIYKYVTKPWDPVDFAVTVDKAIERYELGHELQEKNVKLEAALKDLKSLDEAKNQFMILVNHELKTPLTVILSYLQLLEDTKMNEEQDRYLARIHTASLRLQALINDVLELVSAETRLVKVHAKKISLKDLVDGIDEPFKALLKERGQSLKLDVANAATKADEKIIRTVFNRVLDNAIKFGEPDSVITVSAETTGEKQVTVSIKNRGKSLSKDTIAKILKPFTLDENVMNHTKGAGLGLSICRALLRAHDSDLEIECPKGEFRVSFNLPLA
jgi:two-component system, sensor histidine kinase and response regulator